MTPNFRREMRVGAFPFLALLAALWGSLEDAAEPNLSCVISHKRGGLSRAEGRLWYSLHSSSSDREGSNCHDETPELQTSPRLLPRGVCR